MILHRTISAIAVIVAIVTSASSIYWYRQLESALAANEDLSREVGKLREKDAIVAHAASPVNAPIAELRPQFEAEANDVENSAAPIQKMFQGWVGVMRKPETMQLLAEMHRGAIDLKYGALFEELKLPPEKAAALRELLLERELVANETISTYFAQGLNPTENISDVQTTMYMARADINKDISALLGPEKVGIYEANLSDKGRRQALNQITASLAHSTQPLSAEQGKKLEQVLRSPQADGSPSTPGTLSDYKITQAAVFLTPVQLEALKQQKASQEARNKLQALFREASK